MAVQAMFVHGNAVVAASPRHDLMEVRGADWRESHIVGRRSPEGCTFRGKDGVTTDFYAPIPTPSWRASNWGEPGAHCKLVQVGYRFTAAAGVTILKLVLHTGTAQIGMHMINVGQRQVGWLPGYNFINTIPNPTVNDALNVTFQVYFADEAEITFHTVGAAFDIG